MESDRESEERVVYVICTGGILVMQRNEHKELAPVPNILPSQLRRYPNCHDEKYYRENPAKNNDKRLVLPVIAGIDRRITYELREYAPLQDSSNMGMQDWIRIAKDIALVYAEYDGFVILHGADTLAYTASALSFMLENLNKPVVITGAQLPITDSRSDGIQNLISAVYIAGNFSVPEVCVFFSSQLLRGNRAMKTSCESSKAFASVNTPPLAVFGVELVINNRSIIRPTNKEAFRAYTTLSDNISILRIYPNISVETVRAVLQTPVQGVVLQSYSSGSVPTNRQDIIDELKAAINRGVIIVNTSQSPMCMVTANYEASNILTKIGITPGFDMTQEAALTKLAYVLGKNEWDLMTKKRMMQMNLRGELSSPKDKTQMEFGLIEAITQLHDPNEVEKLSTIIFPALVTAAVLESDVQKLNYLKAQGADLAATNFDGRSALHSACQVGNLDVVKLLLDNGCSVFERDRFNRTPLHEAIDKDNHEVIRLLSDAGAHLQDHPHTIANILCALAERGIVRRLQSFHLAGVELTLPDHTGRTTLHIAANLGHLELVEFLLPHFPNKNLVDHLGHTPLDYARVSRQLKIIHLLSV